MKYFIHDVSRLTVSLTRVVLDTTVCTIKKLKSGIFNYLSDELLNRDEFLSLSKVVKETAIRQSEMEKKLDDLNNLLTRRSNT